MKIRVVHPVASKTSALILVVNVESFQVVPFILLARKWHNHHRLFVRLVVVIKIKRKLLGRHYHEHEIVGSCTFPHSEYFEYVPGRDREAHHLWKRAPGRDLAFQSQKAAHNVIPHFINPQRSIPSPIVRAIFRWIKKSDSVCFGIDDLYVHQLPASIEYFLILCISFGGACYAPQLPARFLRCSAVAATDLASTGVVMLMFEFMRAFANIVVVGEVEQVLNVILVIRI